MKQRRTAWLITIFMMVVGLVLGNYLSFSQMRGRVMAVHTAEIEPAFLNKVVMMHNLAEVYYRNAPDTSQVIVTQVAYTIEQVLYNVRLGSVSPDLASLYRQLIGQYEELYARAAALEISGWDADFIRNNYLDLQEQSMIMAQSRYNGLAQEFNAAIQGGLGFLHRQLPVY